MNIATARKRVGWTQEELAKRIGVSRGAVAQWEMVGGTVPAPKHAVRLLDLLAPHLTWADIYRMDAEAA